MPRHSRTVEVRQSAKMSPERAGEGYVRMASEFGYARPEDGAYIAYRVDGGGHRPRARAPS